MTRTPLNIPFHRRPGPHFSEAEIDPSTFTDPFISFLTENPTVFHAVSFYADRLGQHGFVELSERQPWDGCLARSGKYFVRRNGSSLIAFIVGEQYGPGDGAAIIAGHIDALTARLKPISDLKTKAGYVQLGVAPYAGGMNTTWLDRDLGIAGRVLVRDKHSGSTVSKLVKLGWPIARIPTLAPHFGAAALTSALNKETQMVPIIGLDNSDISGKGGPVGADDHPGKGSGGAKTFASTQPHRLVTAIAKELGVDDYDTIVQWELELYDTQPAQLGGLDKEFIFAGRIDDKLCSFSALEALLASCSCSGKEICRCPTNKESGIIKMVGVFDDEEIGSQLRQGARGNFLSSVMERISQVLDPKACGPDTLYQMYANSFLVSADVTHAVNPNFLEVYMENHAPRLNIGVSVSADPNGNMTTDAVSTAIFQRIADKIGSVLQVFQIRNDSRSGGTVGPMLSSRTGIRAIDAGIPQLSMHSIRATTGSLDPGLGVKMFFGLFEHFERVDKEFKIGI